MSKVYRYKLSHECIKLVEHFAKTHQYDTRKEYKEAWLEYIEIHKDQIQRENTRLINIGYTGNLQDKMFKSGRYYYRNKSVTKTKPKDRRKYISLQNNILQSIYNSIRDQGINLKPAEGYEQYIKDNKELVQKEIDRLNETLSKEEVVLKIKKSYKNQYFNMREKDNNNI